MVLSISEGSVLPDYLGVAATVVLICVELVKFLPVHRYSVDVFSYSGPLGILGSDEKQNSAVALSISFHEQTQ